MVYRNILVAVDGSGSSQRALNRAVQLAQHNSARLTVLGVDEAPPVFAVGERRNGHVNAAVVEAAAHARAAGLNVDVKVLPGYPADVIVRYGNETDSDLIVIGAGGRDDSAVGPTADKVVDLAACAVLIVR